MLLALGIPWIACERPNPAYCDERTPCADPTKRCDSNTCILAGLTAPRCLVSAECKEDLPICEASHCRRCSDSDECKRNGKKAVCHDGQCVECAAASDCSASTPVCDAGRCRGCREDAECPASLLCDTRAETCIAADRVIYVAKSGCPLVGVGTRSSPYCQISDAVGAVDSSRDAIRIEKGTYNEAVYISNKTVGIFGRERPVLRTLEVSEGGSVYVFGLVVGPSPSSGVTCVPYRGNSPSLELEDSIVENHAQTGVALFRCRVAIKNTKVTGSGRVGILSQGSDLRVERVLIANNALGGIDLSQDLANDVMIADSVIVQNGQLVVSQLEHSIGAVRVSGSSSVAIFFGNTLADNKGSEPDDGGVRCEGTNTPMIWNTILWNNLPKELGCEGVPHFSVVRGSPETFGNLNRDPHFRNPLGLDYHLLPDSPARNAGGWPDLPVSKSPALEIHVDFDGQKRVQGSSIDIGADEIQESP